MVTNAMQESLNTDVMESLCQLECEKPKGFSHYDFFPERKSTDELKLQDTIAKVKWSCLLLAVCKVVSLPIRKLF